MEDISLHILDIAYNSIEAGSTIVKISVELVNETMLTVITDDNGRGIPEDRIKIAEDPFYTTRKTRRVGMGLALLAQSAKAADGLFEISRKSGAEKGTIVKAGWKKGHIDRPVLGDVADTFRCLIMARSDIRWMLHLKSSREAIEFDSQEIVRRISPVNITDSGVLNWIEDYLNESIKKVFGGVLNEIIG